MSTEVTIQNNPFKTIKSAVDKMVDTIRPTYGPSSNKVIIDKQTHRLVVDDGVQIARDFELKDPQENSVVKIIRETATKTNDRAGDGTTSSLILLQGILNEVSRRSKIDGRQIENELKIGLEEVKKHLKKTSVKIKSKEDLLKVARISFDDEKISDMIAELYYHLGEDGIVTIDKSPTMETFVEMTDGTKIDYGYVSPYMITNPEKMETVIEKPLILITDYRLTEPTDILPVMERLAKQGKTKLVIIAENIEHNALASVVVNLSHIINPQTGKQGVMQCVAVSVPKHDNSKILLEDLAILTGAKVFTESKGDKVDLADIHDLGTCEKFICRRNESIIVGPKGKKTDIQKAVNALKTSLKTEHDSKIKDYTKVRIGRFTNTMAVIKVGAPTENEQKSLKYKVEDAVNAVRSAYQNGVVCGSGVSLATIKTSSPILNESLKYPLRQLYQNMSLPDPTENISVDNVLNVVTGKSGYFMDVGVTDPVDVLIAGVESAVSIASMLVTVSGIITEHELKDK